MTRNTRHRWPVSSEEVDVVKGTGIVVQRNTCARCGLRRRTTLTDNVWSVTRYYQGRELVATCERGGDDTTPPCPGMTQAAQDATMQRWFQLIVAEHGPLPGWVYADMEPLLKTLIRAGVA